MNAVAATGEGGAAVMYNMAATALKSYVAQDPLSLVGSGALKIITKKGELVGLNPSHTQLRLLHVVETLRRRGKPVRIHGLKARQVYFSTMTEAIAYALASQTPNMTGMVIADDDKGSEYLFGMQQRMQEELQKDLPFLVERTRRSSVQILEWAEKRSWIRTDTARNLRAGRKYMLRFVHLSESAFFPDYDTLTTGLFQSVPDEPGTIIIDESTANGMAGGFYNEVMACYPPKGRWDEELEAWVSPTGWVLLFIPWYEHDEYRSDQVEDLDGIHFASQQDQEVFVDGEETLGSVIQIWWSRRLVKEGHVVTEDTLKRIRTRVEEQLNWRRHKIKHDCKGDLRVFDQEYPDTVDTAFISTGRPALNVAVVTKNLRLSRFTPPKFVGNLEWDNVYVDQNGKMQRGPYIVNDVCLNYGALKVVWREDPHGYWKMWRQPEPGWSNRYCIGGDVAEGLEQGDYDAASVIDRVEKKDGKLSFVDVVATFIGHMDTDLYADELIKAALFYHQALLAIEANNQGLAVIKRVFRMYKWMYFRQDFSKGFPEDTEYVGWQTNEKTKKELVEALNEWLRKEWLRVPDTEFWSQARTFVKDARGRIGAHGKREDPSTKVYDDAVMQLGVNLQAHLWLPKPSQIVPPLAGWRKKVLERSVPRGAMAV